MSSDSSIRKLLLGIISAIVIAVCAISLIKQFTGGPAGFAPTGVQEEVGRALAEAAAAHLDNAGSVAILAIDDSQSPYPFAERQVKAATKALEDAGIQVREPVWLKANQILPEMGVMTVDVYMQAMQPHSDADAIISLCGIPVPDPGAGARQQIGALRSLPPMFCTTQDRGTLAPMMKNGLVLAAVVEKGGAVGMADGKAPKKAEDWFDAAYELVTAPETEPAE